MYFFVHDKLSKYILKNTNCIALELLSVYNKAILKNMRAGISMSVKESAELKEKKRPGRKPMTPEEKAAAAAARAEEKAKADNLKPELVMQYQGTEIDLGSLVEAAKADFHKQKKRTLVTGLKLYVKPEEQMAYYVINEEYKGSVPFVN